MMEIVIKIPEEMFEAIKFKKGNGKLNPSEIAILNGTPLPKGHGRLIDADELWFEDIDDIPCVLQRNVDNAPTIIEADKESEV